MIRFKTTVTFRDDKVKEFDGVEYPRFGDRFLTIMPSHTKAIYLPMDGIQEVQVIDYWKK